MPSKVIPNPVRVFWMDETAWATGSVHGWGNGNNCAVDVTGKPITEDRRKLCCTTKTHWIDHGLKPWPEPDLESEAVKEQLDPRCERCGQLIADVRWYASTHTLYRLPAIRTWSEPFAAGIMIPMDVFPPGAMWDSHWLAGKNGEDQGWTGPDGISLTVKLPNGRHWNVDSQCSNCTRDQYVPIDGPPVVDGPVTSTMRFVRTHYCWVRSGDPRAGWVHVGKDGNTCAAGAGSIWVDQGGPRDWHGFLHDSMLKLC